jgi:hypothetical protein
MTIRKSLIWAAFAIAMLVPAFGKDIAGKWTASFNTQIGEQNYTYEFKVDGEKLTGTAKSNLGSGDITDGIVKGDDVSFVENLKMQEGEIKITYKGKINGDEIKFTRQVGDVATEELVAKRAK